ncbi:MAG: hypothetical protein EBX41_09585 [Chitinophagia bacterium]|nr:hypothetical protein [Chitinophagia bacterium]
MPVYAKAKKSKYKAPAATHCRLIEAYTQRTLSGIPGAEPTNNTRIVVIWKGSAYPETFFWKGPEGGYFNCNSEKAHALSASLKKKYPKGIDYETEPAAGDNIRKGDTLMLTPVIGGKFPIPAQIPANATNRLYYQTGNNGKWYYISVTKIGTKPDIAMP